MKLVLYEPDELYKANEKEVPARKVSTSSAGTSKTAPLPSAVSVKPVTDSTFSSGKNLLKTPKTKLRYTRSVNNIKQNASNTNVVKKWHRPRSLLHRYFVKNLQRKKIISVNPYIYWRHQNKQMHETAKEITKSGEVHYNDVDQIKKNFPRSVCYKGT